MFLLEKLGLYPINTNHSIFVIEISIKSLIISTFIDDIKIIRAKGSRFIEQVQKKLTITFDMVNIGPISFYFGLKVKRNYIKKTPKLF